MDSLQKKPVVGVPTCLHPRGMDTIESDRRDEKRLKKSQENMHKYKKLKKKKDYHGEAHGVLLLPSDLYILDPPSAQPTMISCSPN